MIILIPILLLVFPPLLASVLVMFFWKKKFFKTWARMDLPRGYTLNKFGNADARENQKGAQKADGKEEP